MTDLAEKDFKIDQEAKNGPSKQDQKSIVLSISLCKGCYRHLQVSTNDTLEELADTILEAFDFINDHGHAFFMNNKSYTPDDCYYVDYLTEDHFSNRVYRSTAAYKIQDLSLEKGANFKFVFDFGADWIFQCKVLRVVPTDIDMPIVLKEVGEVPDQYNDDWFDEE